MIQYLHAFLYRICGVKACSHSSAETLLNSGLMHFAAVAGKPA